MESWLDLDEQEDTRVHLRVDNIQQVRTVRRLQRTRGITTLGDVAGASMVGGVRAWSGVRGGTPTEVQEVHDATRVSTQAPELRARPGPRRCRRDPGGGAEDPPRLGSHVSGTAVLSGWQASPAEGNALTQTLLDFQAANPNIKVDYKPIAGDYATVMATNFASHDVPDVFYVNADYAQQWIDQGFLLPLDDYVAKSSFDTKPFFPGYASIFKGTDGKTYGFPKDGSTIGMAFNTALVKAAPATMADLVTTADGLKGTNKLKAPICLNAGLDRGLAFLYAQGGSLLSADGKKEQISTPASKAAVQWYLDLFKNGQGMTASDMGDGWCGDALGKGDAAIAFEGGVARRRDDRAPIRRRPTPGASCRPARPGARSRSLSPCPTRSAPTRRTRIRHGHSCRI